MVNEMNDTFGLMLLSVTLYDFVKIVTEGMYVTVNYSNHNEWYIYVLNTLAILYSLASFFVISLRAQYLTHRVNFSHSFFFLLWCFFDLKLTFFYSSYELAFFQLIGNVETAWNIWRDSNGYIEITVQLT